MPPAEYVFPELSPEEAAAACLDLVERARAVALLEPGGKHVQLVHREHATRQQLANALTAEELKKFYQRQGLVE